MNQLAMLVANLATGQARADKPTEGKDAAAVSLSRRGELKGKKGARRRSIDHEAI